MLHAISGEGVKIMTLAENNSTRGYYKYLYTFILRLANLMEHNTTVISVYKNI